MERHLPFAGRGEACNDSRDGRLSASMIRWDASETSDPFDEPLVAGPNLRTA